MFEKNLFIPDKFDYARKKNRPNVKCILCAYNEPDSPVEKLTVYDAKFHIIACNLYPYNPGHIMIFPKRHIEDVRELTDEENTELFKLRNKAMDIIAKLYEPGGFNIGFNVGGASGASIDHIHLHIVPRYHNEIGFVDILSGAKTYVEAPRQTLERLKKAFNS